MEKAPLDWLKINEQYKEDIANGDFVVWNSFKSNGKIQNHIVTFSGIEALEETEASTSKNKI